ncbi:MAG: spore maturation protein [Gemmatimonadales bacterium]|jgi:spore maturation protein SpmA|nr:spore maturation protein [Gemmatimonadales bacterium]MBT4438496.1 spore maturation protein [Gemmatimonadales bacterium]MBT6373336.1 spore maturation protein [Gemmatimonadales bacterium]MBT7692884.1 spore maturation protein [Gemmatimonadales bacterium]MDG2239949.1 nucleoside recognition domain-containing protein [Longimicrobiales bacterium]
MVLNVIWVGFFLVAFAVAAVKLLFMGDTQVFSSMVTATFDMAETAFEISLGLTGVLTLWLGLMRVGEKGGVIAALSKVVRPFFHRIFPEIPKNHPVHGSMVMNFAANMLGLDNAATPLGLKAMQELQELNPSDDTASNAQIMFLVLNTSGLTLIPISVMVYRAQMGAANPSDVFLPILLTTFFSTMAGLISVAIVQRINLFDRVVMGYMGGLTALIAGMLFYFSRLPQEQVQLVSTVVANVLLFGIITLFILMAAIKRVNVYEAFIEGAKEGFPVVIKIIPYLVAILVGIGVFRASGAMDLLVGGIGWSFAMVGMNTDFIEALPTALMKPLSGSGARGMMVDAMQTHGADSFIGRLTSTFQGSTDTTFYIIALYFGSVSIKKTRHAVACGLIADGTAIVAGIFIGYVFFY